MVKKGVESEFFCSKWKNSQWMDGISALECSTTSWHDMTDQWYVFKSQFSLWNESNKNNKQTNKIYVHFWRYKRHRTGKGAVSEFSIFIAFEKFWFDLDENDGQKSFFKFKCVCDFKSVQVCICT